MNQVVEVEAVENYWEVAQSFLVDVRVVAKLPSALAQYYNVDLKRKIAAARVLQRAFRRYLASKWDSKIAMHDADRRVKERVRSFYKEMKEKADVLVNPQNSRGTFRRNVSFHGLSALAPKVVDTNANINTRSKVSAKAVIVKLAADRLSAKIDTSKLSIDSATKSMRLMKTSLKNYGLPADVFDRLHNSVSLATGMKFLRAMSANPHIYKGVAVRKKRALVELK